MAEKKSKSGNTINIKKPEKIVGKRCHEGCPQVLVKWQGYSDEENTWEPLINMAHCIQMISNYEAEVYLKAQKEKLDRIEKSNLASIKISTLSESSEDEDDEKPPCELIDKSAKANSSTAKKILFSLSDVSEDEDKDDLLPQPILQHKSDEEEASTSSQNSSSNTSFASSSSFNFSSISSSSSSSSLFPNTVNKETVLNQNSLRSINKPCQSMANAGLLPSATCINVQKEDQVQTTKSSTIKDLIELASQQTATVLSPNLDLTLKNFQECENRPNVTSIESTLKILQKQEPKTSGPKVEMNQYKMNTIPNLPWLNLVKLQSQNIQSNPSTLANECKSNNPLDQNELNDTNGSKRLLRLGLKVQYNNSDMQSKTNLEQNGSTLSLSQEPKIYIQTTESKHNMNQINLNITQNLQRCLPGPCTQKSQSKSNFHSNENELHNMKNISRSSSVRHGSPNYSQISRSKFDLKQTEQSLSLPGQPKNLIGVNESKFNMNQNKLNTTQNLQPDLSRLSSQKSQWKSNFHIQTIPSVTNSNENELHNMKNISRSSSVRTGSPNYSQISRSKFDLKQTEQSLRLPGQSKNLLQISESKVYMNPNKMNGTESIQQLAIPQLPNQKVQAKSNVGATLPNISKFQIHNRTVQSVTKSIQNESNSLKNKGQLIRSCSDSHEQNGRFSSLAKIATQVSQLTVKIESNKMDATSSDTLSQHKDQKIQYQLCTRCENECSKKETKPSSQEIANICSPSNEVSTSGSMANSTKSASWRVPQIKRKGPYGMQRGLELDKVIHHFFVGDKLFLFVNWKGMTVTDAVLIENIRHSYPIPIINYFEKFEIYCDFNTNK